VAILPAGPRILTPRVGIAVERSPAERRAAI
jgi:hypothetical protein